ncbi:homoserine O-acetyltransferase MetA [Heyndrickxia oleronia]|uniref:homoserine O-acetyltransferase MetA n=1 Tax=Heyndrickxia oleronia TaxID=38875 RepID=UPI00242ABE3B|nr:homoserine O-succinyltransferase [Heyndrickxia oleronia]MCI1589967.1 homoserine O-succinyltransferase [Heyndrickxia oleronia]MCI1613407.1 homoserine O-succinyltransferase [Heyndrickxia oleronia]MCI1744685.1 homoserine O-succinyltransferase [Heyndrickxia oleronia]MCI1761356.1 homoserine O-succinyltransferase [Heyndrickxia oleronia]
MPINIPRQLPAREILEQENIFVMDDERANSQDIRPLNILILNLMPEKERTEVQLLRLLGNSPLQLNIMFLHMESHESKNVSKSHLEQFYTTFKNIKHRRFDGMIITGAPIELLRFDEVDYWPEMVEIMEWTKTNVTSTLHICWGAQAALYHHFGIDKYELGKKLTGVFKHRVLDPTVKIVRGFDEEFLAPHSRYTGNLRNEMVDSDNLMLLSESDEAGPFLFMSKDGRQIMMTGHLEYDAGTLAEEYTRDQLKGTGEVYLPKHYFPNDNPDEKPLHRWRSHAHLLFSNWLNYYVYQETPYQWE